MSPSSNATLSTTNNKTSLSMLGKPCGHHGQRIFYKAFSYHRSGDQNDTKRVLMLGEFFFLRIPPHDDPCIGELQLLWEDRQRNQLLSSTRLYFLPEQTPDGRQSHHGEDEVLAVSEKVVLRLPDLVSWITHEVDWIAGLPYHWKPSRVCDATNGTETTKNTKCNTVGDLSSSTSSITLSSRAFMHNQNVMSPNRGTFLTSQRIISDRCKISTDSDSSSHVNRGLDFNDVIEEKLKANELQTDLSSVAVLSYSRYCRYRSLLRRLEGGPEDLLHQPAVQDALMELGIPMQRQCRVNILFCRDTFEHEALVNNDLNCDHLAPRMKGRPRRRPLKAKSQRSSSPESISSEENARIQPRRSRRSIPGSGLVSAAINYSEPKISSRRSKPKKSKKPTLNNETQAKNNSRKSVKVKSERRNSSSGSGNDTDTSSVDANNNHTNVQPCPNNNSTSSDANRELKDIIKREADFIHELNRFMKQRKTPIQRVPNLGFKKIDLFLFYTEAQKFGGYEAITKKKLWKKLYDEMGGDKRSTSAATCTRRHYEKLLLPFERFLKGLPDQSTEKGGSSNGSGSCYGSSSKEDELDDELMDNDVDEEAVTGSEEEELFKNGEPSLSSYVLKGVPSKESTSSSSSSSTIVDNNSDPTTSVVVKEECEQPVVLKFSRHATGKANKATKLLTNIETHPLVALGFDLKNHMDDMKSSRHSSNNSDSKNSEGALITFVPSVGKTIKSERSSHGAGNGGGGLFSHSTTAAASNKVTATVHPTKRDIYDFNSADELNPSKKDSSSLFSPMNSISSIVRQAQSDKGSIVRFKLNNDSSQSQSSSSSRSVGGKTTSTDVTLQNAFVRKAFSLPKPLESPIETLHSLKRKNKDETEFTLQPLPAHYNVKSTKVVISNNNEDNNCDLSEILDLSVKKRCLEADSLTSPLMNTVKQNNTADVKHVDTKILDLTVKKSAATEKMKTVSKMMCQAKSLTNGANDPHHHSHQVGGGGDLKKSNNNTVVKSVSQDNTSFVGQQPNKNNNNSTLANNANKSNVVSTQQHQPGSQTTVNKRKSGATNKVNSNGSGARSSNNNSTKNNTNNNCHQQQTNIQTSQATDSQQAIVAAAAAAAAAISEYNPSLPSFSLRSPSSYWSRWPTTTAAAAPSLAQNSPSPFLPNQNLSLFSSAFSSNAAAAAAALAAEPQLGTGGGGGNYFEDQTSSPSSSPYEHLKFMENAATPAAAAANHLFLKHWLEQNQIQANQAAQAIFLQQLFASSSTK